LGVRLKNTKDTLQIDLKEDFNVKFECLKKLVNLMFDVLRSAYRHYGGDYGETRMYPNRQLCMGTMLVSLNNGKASMALVDKDLFYQIHYISRNMVELVVNLYYILDDDREINERFERYKRYSKEILPYQILQVIKKYPEHVKDPPVEKDFAEKEKQYRKFRDKYAMNGKINLENWSGMKLPVLIEKIKDQKDKDELMLLYHFIVKTNNLFIHPTWHYLESALKDAVSRIDYAVRIAQITMIFSSGEKVTRKFLKYFPKSRPEFQKKLTQIYESFYSIKKPAN
jgi:hypothetical protein